MSDATKTATAYGVTTVTCGTASPSPATVTPGGHMNDPTVTPGGYPSPSPQQRTVTGTIWRGVTLTYRNRWGVTFGLFLAAVTLSIRNSVTPLPRDILLIAVGYVGVPYLLMCAWSCWDGARTIVRWARRRRATSNDVAKES